MIHKDYDFMDTVRVGAGSTHKEKERAVGALVAAIRIDLLTGSRVKQTELTAAGFRNLGVPETAVPVSEDEHEKSPAP